MSLPISIIDAFTSKPFSGNPAAVCIVDKVNQEILSEKMMQSIAAEMNLSETAFVFLREDKDDFLQSKRFRLRWFTPTNEVALCGHATLASAASVFHAGNHHDQIEFETMSGVLKADRRDCGGTKDMITLDFPLNPPEPIPVEKVTAIVDAVLGSGSERPALAGAYISPTTGKLVLELDLVIHLNAPKNLNSSRQLLESLRPDLAKLGAIQVEGVRGVIVTIQAQREEEHDFYSRYFAPWVGIPEDPVTGSAHTVLGPFWEKRLGKPEMKAFQCSKRGGDIRLRMEQDRIFISGEFRILMEGNFCIADRT